MLVSYSRCRLFSLNLSCKVVSRSELCGYCVKANNPSCNVYSNDFSLLRKVIDKKKCLKVKKKDTLSKLLCLEA